MALSSLPIHAESIRPDLNGAGSYLRSGMTEPLYFSDIARGEQSIPPGALEQIPEAVRSPLHEAALNIRDLEPGLEVTVFSRHENGLPTHYLSGNVASEPFFGIDDMWWVMVNQRDINHEPRRRLWCLGILGMALNDNLEWNPYYFALATHKA